MFFNITSGDITQLLAYLIAFLDDVKILMLPLIAVSVGLVIYWGLTHSIKK